MNTATAAHEAFEIYTGDGAELNRGLRKRTATKQPGSFITRRAVTRNLHLTGALELRDALKLVDGYFDFLAAAIGGTTVRHSWLLVPPPERYYPPVLADYGISDYTLGADVEIVAGTNLAEAESKESRIAMMLALHEASEDFRVDNGWYICDAAVPCQFIKTDTGPVLVDIDPRLTETFGI